MTSVCSLDSIILPIVALNFLGTAFIAFLFKFWNDLDDDSNYSDCASTKNIEDVIADEALKRYKVENVKHELAKENENIDELADLCLSLSNKFGPLVNNLDPNTQNQVQGLDQHLPHRSRIHGSPGEAALAATEKGENPRALPPRTVNARFHGKTSWWASSKGPQTTGGRGPEVRGRRRASYRRFARARRC